MLKRLRNISLSNGFKQILIYGSGSFFMRGISLLMLPFMTHFLSLAEYGQLEILVTLISFGSILFSGGLTTGLFRYAGAASDIHQRREICAIILGTVLILSALLAVCGLIALPWLESFMPGYLSRTQIISVLIILAINSIQDIQVSWLRLQERPIPYIFFTYGQGLLQAALNLLSLYLGFGVTGIIISTAIATTVSTSSLSILQIKETGFKVNWQKVKPIFLYSLPIMISHFASFAFYGMERWWLANNIALSELAIYGLAMRLASVTYILMEPFATWWHPRRFTLLDQEDAAAVNARISTIEIVLFFGAAVLISLGGYLVIMMMTPAAYHPARKFLPILAVLVATKGASEVMSFGCYLKKTGNNLMFINGFSAILAMILFHLFIPTNGIYGAITALLMVYIVRWALLWNSSQKQLQLPYSFGHIIMVFLISMGLAVLALFATSQSMEIYGLLLTSSVFLLYTLKYKLIPSPKTFINFGN